MAPTECSTGVEHYGWFTPVRTIQFLVAWLSLYVALTLFIAIPFWDETSASAAINWQHTLFRRGFLIGLVGLVAIGVVDAFPFRSYHARSWILVGTLVASLRWHRRHFRRPTLRYACLMDSDSRVFLP